MAIQRGSSVPIFYFFYLHILSQDPWNQTHCCRQTARQGAQNKPRFSALVFVPDVLNCYSMGLNFIVGGSGIFLHLQGFGGKFNTSFPAYTSSFFFKQGISSCTPISLFKPGSVHSDSASWDDCLWALLQSDFEGLPWKTLFCHYKFLDTAGQKDWGQ